MLKVLFKKGGISLLPLPELNDQNFDEIVEKARKQIENMFPYWTDYMPHDPGITFIELLAYLKENQQDFLDIVGDENKKKFLELFGIRPQPAKAARAEVVFTGIDRVRVLPKRTKLQANNLVFETTERLILSPNSLKALLIKEDEQQTNIESRQMDKHRAISAFGRNPKAGNQMHMIFDQAFEEEQEVKVKIDLFEDYPVKRNPVKKGEAFFPISNLCWEYYGIEDGYTGWHPLLIKEDTTFGLLFSGFISFSFSGRQLYLDTGEEELNGYCLRCTLVENGYEVVPKIKQVLLNSAVVEQKDTLSESFEFSLKQAADDEVYIDSYLAYYEHVMVFANIGGFWIELGLNGSGCRIIKDTDKKICRVLLDEAILEQLQEEEDNVLKFVAVKDSFTDASIVGSSTGMADQEVELKLENVMYDEFELMVGKLLPEKMGWREWKKVASLDKAGPDSLSYEFDSHQGIIRFGDNESGHSPEKASSNILITDCALTQADAGNIHVGNITGFYDRTQDLEGVKVFQIYSAEGGRQAEKLEDVEKNMRRALKGNQRLVTTEDYEHFLYDTPGLMIKNIKVLPLYKPGLRGYPDNKEENCVTLVVEPYCENDNGELTGGYIKNIKYHINKRRLLTTSVYVISPEFVGLEVYGELVIKSDFGAAAEMIEAKLNKYIDKVQRGQPMRSTFSYGDIYGELDLMHCVSYIRYLSIETSGYRAEKTREGDIKIPPDGRAYLKKNELILVNSEEY